MTTAVEGPSLTNRVLALVLRPFCIFFGVTLLAYVLLGKSGISRSLDSYPSWLSEFPSLDVGPNTIEGSLQLLVGATVVALMLGSGFGAAMRAGPLGRILAGLSLPVISIAGPGFALFLLYWLVIRAGVFSFDGFASITDDPILAVKAAIAPSLAVGIPLAPTVAVMVAQRDRFTDPFGLVAIDALLASRSGEREGWRFAIPAGALFTAIFSTELVFARPGIGLAFVLAMARFDARLTLNIIGLIALGGAGLALLVDLVGLRPHTAPRPTASGLRLASYSSRPPSRLLLAGVLGLAALVLIAAVGGQLVDPEAIDGSGPLVGPFTDGHLFGTDAIGRDVLSSALAALGGDLVLSMIPGLGAALAGAALASIHRQLGGVSHVVPGTPIDALWAPLPVFMILAVLAFGIGSSASHPGVLAITTLVMVPTASRLVRREPISLDGGGVIGLVGVWLLLTATALLARAVISYAGFAGLSRRSLGGGIRDASIAIDSSTWPAIVPTLALAITLLALNSTGAALVHLGRHRSTKRLIAQLDDGETDDPILLHPPSTFENWPPPEPAQHEVTLPAFPAIGGSGFPPPPERPKAPPVERPKAPPVERP